MHKTDSCPLTVSIIVVFISVLCHPDRIISRFQLIFKGQVDKPVLGLFSYLDLAGLRLI